MASLRFPRFLTATHVMRGLRKSSQERRAFPYVLMVDSKRVPPAQDEAEIAPPGAPQRTQRKKPKTFAIRTYNQAISDCGNQKYELDIARHRSHTPALIESSSRAAPPSFPFHAEWRARSQSLQRVVFAGHTVVSVL
jgi:hypothetical protein